MNLIVKTNFKYYKNNLKKAVFNKTLFLFILINEWTILSNNFFFLVDK